MTLRTLNLGTYSIIVHEGHAGLFVATVGVQEVLGVRLEDLEWVGLWVRCWQVGSPKL